MASSSLEADFASISITEGKDDLSWWDRKIIPIMFISYSSDNTFHGCPRQFELDKMGQGGLDISSPHFAFGSAVGAGIQSLVSGHTLDEAWMEAFLAWDIHIEDGYAKSKKTFGQALDAIKTFQSYAQVLSADWEIFKYEGPEGLLKNAVELNAKVSLPNGFTYRIYIDIVLRNKVSGELLVLELKTTGYNNVDEAMYGNSNQALSYGVVLDRIASGYSSFSVWYYVYSTAKEDWEFFDFPKSKVDKANWIRTILYDTGNIAKCMEDGFFPKQGESCIQWGHRCNYYGACGMSNDSLYAGEHTIALRVKKELETKYDFSFTLEEIIEQQLEDIKRHDAA